VGARHRADAGYTLTSGVVSATARRRRQNTTVFAQTDAHANYGSLGGAVVDAGGQLVGMVVMLGPDDERLPWAINSGVAMFADSAAVLRVLPGLIQGKSIRSAAIVGLGVVFDPPLDLPLRVRTVEQGTGAEAAGIKPGDLLIAIDGKEISSLAIIARTVLRHREGDHVTLVVRRAGTELTVEVELRTFQPEHE
jgi:serine protease Do